MARLDVEKMARQLADDMSSDGLFPESARHHAAQRLAAFARAVGRECAHEVVDYALWCEDERDECSRESGTWCIWDARAKGAHNAADAIRRAFRTPRRK